MMMHFHKIERIHFQIEISHIKIKSIASEIAMYHYVLKPNFINKIMFNLKNLSAMKTKVFLLVCLIMGIGLTQLSAQSVKFTGTFDYWQPVYCNGVQIDWLTGTTIYSGIEHYKDGVAIFQNYHNRGEVASGITHEVFKVIETDKVFQLDQNSNFTTCIWHTNLKGDQGSHYLGTMTWDLITNIITVDKFVCVDNGPGKK
jgi:hypothetical protein